MQELIEKIQNETEAFVKDAGLQATKNNKAAGVRARKKALELIGLLKQFRKISLEASK